MFLPFFVRAFGLGVMVMAGVREGNVGRSAGLIFRLAANGARSFAVPFKPFHTSRYSVSIGISSNSRSLLFQPFGEDLR